MQTEITNPVDYLSKSSFPNKNVKGGQSIFNGSAMEYDSAHTYKSNEHIFVICDVCFWATTYLDKHRLPVLDSRCLRCQEIGLSSFPILNNESFTYEYSEKRGVELRFMSRKR